MSCEVGTVRTPIHWQVGKLRHWVGALTGLSSCSERGLEPYHTEERGLGDCTLLLGLCSLLVEKWGGADPTQGGREQLTRCHTLEFSQRLAKLGPKGEVLLVRLLFKVQAWTH